MSAAIWMKLKFRRDDEYVLNGIVESAQRVRKAFIPFFAVGQNQLWNTVDMKPSHM